MRQGECYKEANSGENGGWVMWGCGGGVCCACKVGLGEGVLDMH